jgi:hypothetical protein
MMEVLRRLRKPSFALWFPLAVYALIRLVDVGLILAAQRHQIALPSLGKPAHPGYFAVATNWDGEWYRGIALNGYPTTLPRASTGDVAKNAWGFYPAYPFTVGALTRLTGLSFNVIAPLLSLVFGAAAMVAMFRLLNEVAGRLVASATVVLACSYIAAPVTHIAYTESMALLLICSALLLLRRRRYGWFAVVVVLLALTRPVAIVFVPVVCWHGIWRYRRRDLEPFPTRDRWVVVAVGLVCVAATGLWPAIAGLVTGVPTAYTQTMSSWGAPGDTRVLTAWTVTAWESGGVAGALALAGALFVVVLLTLRRGAGAWGPEVRAWALAYPIFVLLTTSPGPSSPRHLFLAFPLMWPLPECSTSPLDRRLRLIAFTVLVAIGVGSQWFWVDQFLVISTTSSVGLFP